jgi:hypothetical protein
VAPEGVTAHGRKDGSFFLLDPAAGALVVEADLRLKIGNALRRQTRRLQFRLNLSQSGPYLPKFHLQARSAASQLAGKINGNLLKFTINGHGKLLMSHLG